MAGEICDRGTLMRFTLPCSDSMAFFSLQSVVMLAVQMNEVCATVGSVLGSCTCEAAHSAPATAATPSRPPR